MSVAIATGTFALADVADRWQLEDDALLGFRALEFLGWFAEIGLVAEIAPGEYAVTPGGWELSRSLVDAWETS